jgi:hypothetical protein
MNYEDRVEILNLIYQYSYTYDNNEMEEFISLFTNDGVWEAPIGKAKTSKEIYSLLATRREAIAAIGIQNRLFQTNTILTEISPNRVEGKTMVLVTWQFPDEKYAQVHLTGFYKDEFTRTEEGWKFAKRILQVDQASDDISIG